MSFVNAAKQAQEQIKKEQEWQKMHGDPVKSSGITSTNFPKKANLPDLIGDQRKRDAIAAEVDKAEAIFNPEPDPNNPNHIFNKIWSGAKSALESVGDFLEGATTPQSGSSAKPIVYSDWSPAAQQFGMDQQTAYAEHMANTAHQREVADLRAAGLNPVLGVGSGASGVAGHVATSGSSAQKSLNGDFIVDAIGATAAVVTAILTKNPAYGYMAGNAVNAVGDMFTNGKKINK